MIDHLDHLVLTTAREADCVDFYTRVLGMQLESFVGGTPPAQHRGPRSTKSSCQGRSHYRSASSP